MENLIFSSFKEDIMSRSHSLDDEREMGFP